MIQKLEDHSILIECWSYITIKDICQLLIVNKAIREISLKINKLIPQKISLNRERNLVKLRNLIILFPNIIDFALSLLDNPNITVSQYLDNHQNYYKILKDQSLFVGPVLSVLYESKPVCQSLEALTITKISDYKISYSGISNLKNLKCLDVTCFDINKLEVKEICTMTSLISLSLSGYTISLTKIWKLTKLEKLINQFKIFR